MSLKYTCPSCGTPLGYEGLCWKCKCEQERQAALAWMPEQIVEKQRNLIQNIQRLADMEDPEFADFWQLLGYHDAITPEIQRVALAAEVFWPCEIYYHAPADVRDGLIHALLSAEYSSAASNLMSCLAMQGDDKAMETLLERNPRPWRKGLYVDPSSYAQIGGWTFDKEGQKIQLNFDTCYPMVKGTTGEKSPVRIGREREDTCPHCGGRTVDILVLDGRDERLRFLGLNGVLTADEDVETVGLKRINLYRFDAKQVKLLMVLWLLFLERMGYADPVHITVGDIIDKCKIYQINMKPVDFKDSYRIFKKFSLIDYSDDISTEEGKVRLYPSLQFCMDIGQLKQVMAEYTSDGENIETWQDELLESEDTDE